MAVLDTDFPAAYEAVLELFESWIINDPPTASEYGYGLTRRYREQASSGHWIVFGLDTVSVPPTIDVYSIFDS